MKSILNNPYRVIGLLAGATARERNAKISRLLMYLEAGQEPPRGEDCAFPALGTLSRTDTAVSEAASRLDLDSDRMNAALFWFYTGNDITDEPAFDALADNDPDYAAEIWTKLTASGTVTPRNSSAFHNLSTLLLCRSQQMKSGAVAAFEQALALKIKFLESDCLRDFVTRTTDKTFRVTAAELELSFLRTLMKDIESANKRNITTARAIKALSTLSFAAKSDFMEEFAKGFAAEIERKAEDAARKRKDNPARADSIGSKLYDDTSGDLATLKNLTGANDLKYTSATDSVAEEILLCSIDYYNNSKADSEGQQENLETMMALAMLAQMLKKERNQTVEDAQELLNETKPLLKMLKNADDNSPATGKSKKDVAESLLLKGQSLVVGSALRKRFEDSRKTLANMGGSSGAGGHYRTLSSLIADKALDMTIADVNSMIENRPNVTVLIKKINEAHTLMAEIEKMELNSEVRARLEKNREALSGGKQSGNSEQPVQRAPVQRTPAKTVFEQKASGQKPPAPKPAGKRQPAPKRRTTINGLTFRGGTAWAAVKYFFWTTIIPVALFALLEYRWHVVSDPAAVGKFVRSLPYSLVMFWFFCTSYGIASLVKRRMPAFGVFITFLANMWLFYIYKNTYMIVQEKTALSLLDSISFWVLAFGILFYAMFKIQQLKAMNPGGHLASTMFRLNGSPGVMYWTYFFRSLLLPLIAVCIIDLGNLSVNSVWHAIFSIYGFFWAYDNIRMMLLCNTRRLNRSKMSRFWHSQHLILFLPELALFLIWYFDWLPMPRWVSGTLIVYGFFWLLSALGMLTMKER
ncbi:MAG: hypothetical protein LBS42_03925 [Tannerella sp.]|jgi:hypothetical protein|nr:hypothetical protein [Tannerella sp.]